MPVPINSLFWILVDQPVVDIYTAPPAPPPLAPASASSDTAARRLPSGAFIGIILAVVVAVIINALVFLKTKKLTAANSWGRMWCNFALVFGPLVWLVYWCKVGRKARKAEESKNAQHLMA